MAKRTLNALALLITKRVDKNTSDSTFVSFVEDMLTLTLQEIIAAVPNARWLRDEDTLTTASGTQYVTLPSDMDVDAIASLRDETNNRPLVRISAEKADQIDPGRDLTGDEILWWHQRVGTEDRIYFLNQPDSIDSIKAVFGNVITDPTTGQTCALPAKYEYGWIEGTLPKLTPRIKGIDVALHEGKFRDFIENVVKRDSNATPGESNVMISHRPFQANGPYGPSFPADFDISK